MNIPTNKLFDVTVNGLQLVKEAKKLATNLLKNRTRKGFRKGTVIRIDVNKVLKENKEVIIAKAVETKLKQQGSNFDFSTFFIKEVVKDELQAVCFKFDEVSYPLIEPKLPVQESVLDSKETSTKTYTEVFLEENNLLELKTGVTRNRWNYLLFKAWHLQKGLNITFNPKNITQVFELYYKAFDEQSKLDVTEKQEAVLKVAELIKNPALDKIKWKDQ